MSEGNGNGVIRIGRKGRRKFAFGEDGAPFEVDVVAAFQEWVCIDESIRDQFEDRVIPNSAMPEFHAQAVAFATRLAGKLTDGPPTVCPAEAMDFIARLREQYDEVATFFHPRSRAERDSPDTSAVELRFSEEPAAN